MASRQDVKVQLDKDYQFKFTTQDLDELEENLGKTLVDISRDVLAMSSRAIRRVLFYGLRHEGRTHLTLNKVGLLIDGYLERDGDLRVVAHAALEALAKTGALGEELETEMLKIVGQERGKLGNALGVIGA